MVSKKVIIADTCETHGLKDCPSCIKMARGNSQLIIAEIGQNHMGDMTLAKQLISLAQANGGDLCKFQLYDHKVLYKNHPEIPDVALSFDQAKMLFDYGKEVGIEVFFSVFDVKRVEWCEEIGVKRYKIAARMRDVSVLRAVENTGRSAFISVDPNIASARNFGGIQLFCLSQYPAMVSLKYIDFPYGYQGFSDHTIGLDAAKIALARGAKVIEKHFAIDHNTGIDAKWSMTPDELAELVRFSKVVKEVL